MLSRKSTRLLNPLDEDCGIYRITNTVNGKFYVGSSINMRYRQYTHLSGLRNGKHDNNYLQCAFNKHGEQSFFFEVLEKCDDDVLLEREQWYLDTLSPADRAIGYNLNAQATGGNSSPESKAKRRQTMAAKKAAGYIPHWTGRRHTEESKRLIGLHKKGKTVEELYGEEKGRELRRLNSRTGSTNPMYGSARFGEKNPMFGKKRAWLFNPVTEELLSLTDPTPEVLASYLNSGWVKGRKKGYHGHKAKAVNQYDLEGNFIASHRTMTEAAQAVGTVVSNIGLLLSGAKYRKTAGGFKWGYAV